MSSADSRAHYERLARNAASKAMAENDAQQWTQDEVDMLMAFWPETSKGHDSEVEVAEAIGRTIEACRQKFYTERRGLHRTVVARETRTTTTTTTERRYIGLHDDPEDQWWSPDYYTNEK